jgi:hypothetical protein
MLSLGERPVRYMLKHLVNQLYGLRHSRSLEFYRVVGKVHWKAVELRAQRRLVGA